MALSKNSTAGVGYSISMFTHLLQERRRVAQFDQGISDEDISKSIRSDAEINASSPEATLARILEEWVQLRELKIDTQISMIEWRVFMKIFWHGYPDFSNIDEWILWRLKFEFQGHSFPEEEGWSKAFLHWAKDKAIGYFS